MQSMKGYYISRAFIALLLGVLFGLLNSWWMGLLVGGMTMLWFILAPRTGRYTVEPQNGATALARDERAEVINAYAGRNAFVVMMLLGMVLLLLQGYTALEFSIAVALSLLLLGGVVTYYLSDLFLRRRM